MQAMFRGTPEIENVQKSSLSSTFSYSQQSQQFEIQSKSLISLVILFTGNKNREEQEKVEYEPMETHSEETVNKWREELQALLDKMVEMTQGCSVETLERYHNRLQLSVHHHRYNADKTELIKVRNCREI